MKTWTWKTVSSPEARFWAKVHKTPNCWLWTGAISAGYGVLRRGRKAQNILAHRFMWELQYGMIPKGCIICHRCDIPKCVNPRHLFIGTQRDNIQDAIKKGRVVPWGKHFGQAKGEKHGRAKLALADVQELRHLRQEGMNYRQLGQRFGITGTQACRIVLRHNWL